MVSPSSPSAVVGLLERDLCYKSVATQIPQDVGLVPIPYTARKILLHRRSNHRRFRYYELKAPCFKPSDHWTETNTIKEVKLPFHPNRYACYLH